MLIIIQRYIDYKYIFFSCRYVLDNPNIVDGKTVVDVGSGCGACAIAAAMKGAKYVIANDVDPGIYIASQRCKLLGLKFIIAARKLNWSSFSK